jgi:hypothetical protein
MGGSLERVDVLPTTATREAVDEQFLSFQADGSKCFLEEVHEPEVVSSK